MAIDNFGVVYGAMTTVNTDSKVMCLFIRELVKILDKEDPNFHSYTAFYHDGAAYSKHPAFMEVLKELRLSFMTSAPHSYNCSFIELLFGAIKTNTLAAADQPLAKR